MPTALEWLTLKPLRDAVRENRKAHEKLKKTVEGRTACGLQKVDELLRGKPDDAATQS